MPFKIKDVEKVYMLEYRKQHKDYFSKKYKEWAKNNRIKIKNNRKKWLQKNKYKLSAERKVHYQIKIGKLIRLPCEICCVVKTEAHHDDYSKPLLVRWLCRKHHKEHHRKYN